MVLVIPFQALIFRNIKTYQMEQMKNKDRRNKMMDEILNGMKIIKLYAWESSFLRKVNAIRDQEIYALKVSHCHIVLMQYNSKPSYATFSECFSRILNFTLTLKLKKYIIYNICK